MKSVTYWQKKIDFIGCASLIIITFFHLFCSGAIKGELSHWRNISKSPVAYELKKNLQYYRANKLVAHIQCLHFSDDCMWSHKSLF